MRLPGEFGQLCKATLLSSNSNSADVSGEFEVSVRLLRPQASERAKLDFLLEAALMSHFEHANVLRLEALVSASEPGMLLAEWTQHGPLDVYLRVSKQLGHSVCVEQIEKKGKASSHTNQSALARTERSLSHSLFSISLSLLPSNLQDNKGSLGALQLISMLRGIAHGMQYLAKLNFVHKVSVLMSVCVCV